jgi:nucleoside-diphosphate-sugar epimerase
VRVLITGTEGYIGSVMAPLLIKQGHEVVGLDTAYFRDAKLEPDVAPPFPIIAKDLRHLTRGDLDGFDAVIHLAGLSNDALGQLFRPVTFDVNHRASIRLASMAKDAGVQRFIYSSSCSVYGRSAESVVSEASTVDPQTDYAVCKMLDEWEIADLADDSFSPTFLRNATAYGASPRMRFDLVVNDLSGLAWTTGRIKMLSDGTPWRPLVHVLDISAAFLATLEAPRVAVHNQVFNVGDSDENYQIRDIALCIGEVFPGCEVTFGASDPDQRSYRVRFDRIQQVLPGFRCEWTLRKGAEQLRALFERVELAEPTFRFRAFKRLNQLKHLIETGQVDADFFWKT